jgi:flagellar export protein FliJ
MVKQRPFRLEALLALRAREVEQARGVVLQEEARLGVIQTERTRVQHNIAEAYSQLQEASSLMLYGLDYLGYLDRQRQLTSQLDGKIRTQQQHVDKAKAALLAIKIQEKALEKLKQKQKKAEHLTYQQADNALMDELAQQRFFNPIL